MPGLLRGMARTAVVAGTAAHVAGNVQHRQQEKWAQQDEQAQATQQPQQNQPTYGETVSPQDTDAQIDQLEKLSALRDSGVLTEAEFDTKKREILGS